MAFTLIRFAPLSLSLLLACDLSPKDIGMESESNEGSGEGEDGGSDGGASVGGGSGEGGTCEDGDTMPAPDGCNTCSCHSGQWACTQLGCPGTDDGAQTDSGSDDGGGDTGSGGGWFGDEVLVCDPGAPMDAIGINSAVIDGDTLNLSVSYGGGCEEHDFGMCWDAAFAESDPVQVWTFLAHESHDDACEAYLTEDLPIDLTPLRDAWIAGYQSEHGSIDIHLEGWGESLLYTF